MLLALTWAVASQTLIWNTRGRVLWLSAHPVLERYVFFLSRSCNLCDHQHGEESTLVVLTMSDIKAKGQGRPGCRVVSCVKVPARLPR